MRIVQVSTDTLPVPPQKYGGIQRIVYTLTEELVKRGHEVILYAPKGSQSSATIIPYEHKGPNNQAIVDFIKKTLPPHVDIIHDHTHNSVIDHHFKVPTISTIHINNSSFPRFPVYISKKALKEVGHNKGFCIYNGIDLREYEFSEEKKDYLLFLGEVSPKKGIQHAIEIAEKTNRKLIIAGPIFDKTYFKKEIESKISGNQKIEYIGEVGGKEKQELIKHANCFLFPTSWREPFGLVMIESMACGTPVIALNNGAVSEVLAEFPELICNNVTEMIEKVVNQSFPAPTKLREYVTENFSSEKMNAEYIKLYEKIIYEKISPIYSPTILEDELPLSKIMFCYESAKLFEEKGEFEKAIDSCLKSFQYDIPRAEICCTLGFLFKKKANWKQAIFWFNTATQLEKPMKIDELYFEESWTWMPHLQLCVCYDRLGDLQKSFYHNEMAGHYIPQDWRVLQNRDYLKKAMHKRLQPLKIVQVAPDIYSLPSIYGGIEKIVYDLTEELVALGHEVYLFAPAGTITSGKLISYKHQGTWKADKIVEYVKMCLPEKVDIIHDHTHYSSVGKEVLPAPIICSIHISSNNKVDNPVFVSEKMLQTVGHGKGRFIHNGINLNEYQFSEEKLDYFLYFSRLSKQKGTHFALDICEKGNLPLKLAGPISNEAEYLKEFEPRIKRNPNIEYLGSVGGVQKQELLKHAKCLLFPTNCNEAFGLVMIESMACGTPVLALENGAVSEVLRGFPELVCHSVDEMLEKALTMSLPTPKLLREYVATHFTTKMMTERYLDLYKKIIGKII